MHEREQIEAAEGLRPTKGCSLKNHLHFIRQAANAANKTSMNNTKTACAARSASSLLMPRNSRRMAKPHQGCSLSERWRWAWRVAIPARAQYKAPMMYAPAGQRTAH